MPVFTIFVKEKGPAELQPHADHPPAVSSFPDPANPVSHPTPADESAKDGTYISARTPL